MDHGQTALNSVSYPGRPEYLRRKCITGRSLYRSCELMNGPNFSCDVV